MPRLSLYKPEKGLDYKFIDRQISESFQVGGTDVYVHKYMGPKIASSGTADQPIYSALNPTNIQDLLFLENRDRKYDSEIYRIRGIYNVQNIDFNLSQFGLFIDANIIYMTVHINDFIKFLGRKPIIGDVMELPHLRDEFALNDYDISLPRYYVIEDVGRASEGFSATWYPHLYRLKLNKITDNQQFADILNMPVGSDMDHFVGDYDPGTTYYAGDIVRYNGDLYTVTATTHNNEPPNTDYFILYTGNTLENILSTKSKELEINDAILRQAEIDSPTSGYQTRQFYTLAVDPLTGKPLLETADETTLAASNTSYNASDNNTRPVRTGYTGYLVGDGFPSNGYDFGHGIQFPANPGKDDFFLRTDFMPNRLFRFNGDRWIKVEDNVRMSLSNVDTRQTQKTTFINNDKYIYNDEVAVDMIRIVYGDHVIDTTVNYQSIPYVVFKYESYVMSFSSAEYSTLITSYTDSFNIDKIRITLPVINNEQVVIPETGFWKIIFCNSREEQRQGLSQVLKPKADL